MYEFFSLASVAFPLHEYFFVLPSPPPFITFLRSSSVRGSVPERLKGGLALIHE